MTVISVYSIKRTAGGHTQSLNFGSLGVWLLGFILGFYFPSDDKLADIIFLCQSKESTDLGSSLGTKAFRVGDIGKAWKFLFALLDNDNGEDGKIGANNTSTDGFTFALTGTTRAVARVTSGKKETDTSWVQDTLDKLA